MLSVDIYYFNFHNNPIINWCNELVLMRKVRERYEEWGKQGMLRQTSRDNMLYSENSKKLRIARS